MRKLLIRIIFNRFFPKWITFKIIYKWNSDKFYQPAKMRIKAMSFAEWLKLFQERDISFKARKRLWQGYLEYKRAVGDSAS